MARRILHPLFLVLAVAGALGVPAGTWACDTPVFQYALERWYPDPYPVLIFHKEPLSGKAAEVAKLLQDPPGPEETNIEARMVDVSKEIPAPLRKLWEAHKTAKLPLLVVLYPERSHMEGALWAGPVAEAVPQVIHSPARKELARRIIEKHHVAVWTLVECGDKKADDKAVKTLEESLKKAPAVLREQGLVPPEKGAEKDPKEKVRPAPKIEFSILRISRKDLKEELLIKMLSGVAPKLDQKDKISKPIVFPVFGRGRALGALVGEDIDADNILTGCAFLFGSCSCEIKAQNPGVDLLFSATWSEAVESQGLDELPSLPVKKAGGKEQGAGGKK